MLGNLTLFQSDSHAAQSLGAGLQQLVGVTARLVLAPVRYYRARAELTRLSALSDHELKDIGLTRTDIQSVGALPLEVDPTSVLAQMVHERHCARPRF